jgi:hypothetical protein
MTDEVIEELWRVKDDMARMHGYDVGQLIADLRVREGQEEEDRIVDLHALCNAGQRQVSPPAGPSEGIGRHQP